MRKSAPLFCALLLSLSARRAWIEIFSSLDDILAGVVALRKESVDRNQNCCPYLSSLTRSLSARRAWIEIKKKGRARRPGQVALRKESVDRNKSRFHYFDISGVVALRKESVDRNHAVQVVVIVVNTSLSARRAWIEI